ncbi:hypothetical protein [Kitasatospora sp. NPDC097643]
MTNAAAHPLPAGRRLRLPVRQLHYRHWTVAATTEPFAEHTARFAPR